MKFQSIGGGKHIGANCHFLQLDRIGMLLDAGMHPVRYGHESLPSFDFVRDHLIDAILVTHCHLDHIGALPMAIKNFPHSRIFMTYASSFLYSTLLHNTVTVMRLLKEEKDILEYPLYSHEDVDLVSYIVQGMKFEKSFKIYGHDNSQVGIEGKWYPAGHTLGAGGLYLHAREGRVFYTGDTSASNQFLIRGAVNPKDPVDILISECTLGANEEAESIKRKQEVQTLIKILNETFNKKGTVLIPAFALGKTQEMLWLVNNLKQRKLIPDVDIYVSGMGRAIARIYDLTIEYSHRVDDQYFFDDVEFSVIDQQDTLSHGLWLKRPSVIIASSGMMHENTPSYWLAYKMMREPQHTICFVGYTSPDSAAHVVAHSKKHESIVLPGLSESVPRHCRIERVHFSGHSTRQEVLKTIQNINPKKLILVHGGNDAALEWMNKQVTDWNNKIEVMTPEIGQTIEL